MTHRSISFPLKPEQQKAFSRQLQLALLESFAQEGKLTLAQYDRCCQILGLSLRGDPASGSQRREV